MPDVNNQEVKPEVSVIVPIYNVEPYLRRCIDSLINPTLQVLRSSWSTTAPPTAAAKSATNTLLRMPEYVSYIIVTCFGETAIPRERFTRMCI